jgi:hypothetical protein
MPKNPITALPAAYAEARRVVLTEPRLLLWLNLGGIIPLIAALLLMSGYWSLIAPLRPSILPDRAPLPDLLMLIVVIVIVFPVHELVHGAAIAWIGHQPRYGAKLNKGVLYTTAENALFRRDEYLLVLIAPLVAITLAALLLLWIVPNGWVYWLSLAVVLNAGGAVGDLWVFGMLLRYPRRVLVRDEADGFTVYA